MARSNIAVSVVVAAVIVLLAAVCFFDSTTPLGRGIFLPVQEDWNLAPHNVLKYKGRQSDSPYLLGVGKADITGPVVEFNLMGYANSSQIGTGLRQRLYSRAFVIGDAANPSSRFVYLVLDTQSGDTAIRNGILDGLRRLGQDYAVYGPQNVAVTGTHSHSGPAAWLNYLLPQVTSKGFEPQSYQAIVDGAILSIKRAHENATPGKLSVGTTRIEDTNINRSLYGYLANPEQERAKYNDDSVDKDLTLLRFTRQSDGKDIGILSWFPVHGTSMLGNNTLVTGDNKGVAAYLFEKAASGKGNAAPGFVAGFSQANVGDTSPNINGAYCEGGVDDGKECKLQDSTCGGQNEPCHGRGPFFGLNDAGTKSCFEIGRRQFQGAKELYDKMVSSSTPISGNAVRAFHTFVDLSTYSFKHPNGSTVRTCPAALGYSFAAGTTDGPGAFDFKQNDTGEPDANPIWGIVSNLLHAANDSQRACQAPKPILLDAGETHAPYDWAPNIVDVQLLRVGQMFMIISSGEASTMAGRRWREAVANAAKSMVSGGSSPEGDASEPVVVLGGPANSYTHYITTEEEYGVQRYEGASTLYGPNTLNAYINLTLTYLPNLASSATQGNPLQVNGPRPQDNRNSSLNLNTPVVQDNPAFGRNYGDVLSDVQTSYSAGQVAKATFIGANPRNNLRLEGTFAGVEKLTSSQGAPEQWQLVKTDEDWELIYEWKRTNDLFGTSEVTISWEIPSADGAQQGAEAGTYRLRYWGDAKGFAGPVKPFEAASGKFTVN